MDQRNENRGRDQNIFNQPGTVVIHQAEQPSRSRVEQQLLQIVRQEVESRLRQSLHNAVLINLGKEAQPEQVKRPWDAEIKIGTRPAEPIPADTSILEVFDRSDIGGKLLILGNPGSGKTTTLLDLAKALIDRAETDAAFPMPVLFNLSSWKDDQQLMQDWLVAELKSKYGVRQDIGKQWLQDRALLPLLDGLDEVKPERQESCVKAINTLLTGEAAPLDAVVCSRREEYNAYESTLQLNGAICLQALTLPQIQDYLAQVNRSELWELLNRDPELLELVQAPLFLSIVLLAYPQDSLEDWQQLGSTQERLQDLWDRYICRMFERELLDNPYSRKAEPSQQQARRWLVWLAQQMQRESQTEFLIEKMQPRWLVGPERRIYRLIGRLIGGLIGGPFSGLIGGLFSGLIDRLLVWLYFGLFSGLLVGELDNITPIEAIQIPISREKLRISLRELRDGLIYGVSAGVSAGVGAGVIGGLSAVLSTVLILGLIFGLAGLIFGLIGGLKADIEIRLQPNQGIQNSARNTIIFSGVGLAASFVLYSFLPLIPNSLMNSGTISSIVSSSVATLICISLAAGGGLACIQHFALRCALFRSGVSPWNYARFLDYASERLLMQRVGGRYRFIHKLLQDHFAEMALPPKSPTSGGL